MSSIHEQISEQFLRWERRGRGWQVYDAPVSPEPAFCPFVFQSPQQGHDDGRRETFLSSLIQSISRKLSGKPQVPLLAQQDADDPEPRWLVRDSLVELQVTAPIDLNVSKESFEQFLLNLFTCTEPITFEILGTSQRVRIQFAAHPNDASNVLRDLQGYVPEVVIQSHESQLESVWESCGGEEVLVVEFGLAKQFMFPISTGKFDAFIGLISALGSLQFDELGLFQVIFEPVREPWGEHIVQAVSDRGGRPLFVNAPELFEAAKSKTAKPLYAAVIRIGVKSGSFERTLEIARSLASALRVFSHPQGNELIPLENDNYLFDEHVEDLLRRQSRRSGVILNSDELVGFVHLPSSSVRSPALERQVARTKAAPAIVRQETGLFLGKNEYAGVNASVRLTPEQRVRHCHIIGASGTGKSTLLFNLIQEGIQAGEGLAVLDPHGDLIDRICGVIPPERVDDVILVDPSDAEYSIAFNILSAHSDVEKNLLASDLVAVFQRLSTSWGDQMNSVLQNAILAFLESERGGTIADLRRFLIEPAFRNDFLKTVKDSEVAYYWHKSFPHLQGNKSIGSLLTRLDLFLAQKPIRYMVSQPENRLNFSDIMDSGKIFLAKLPEGLLGRENSHLLGALLVSKFQQIVMSRQSQHISARRDFWFYIDEFANFITPSMAEILSGARKYRIGLTLAHHELHQLKRVSDVESAVMSHPFSRIVFRVGDADAKELAEGFSFFQKSDLRNLETGNAICRVERSDYDFNLRVPLPQNPDPQVTLKRRQEVIAASRKKYGRLRSEIEAALEIARTPIIPDAAPKSTGSRKEKVVVVPVTPRPSAPASPPIQKVPDVEPSNLVTQTPKPAVSDEQPRLLAERESPQPRDMGRGGENHKRIQKEIKGLAEDLGFRVSIEAPIPNSEAGIDVLLVKGAYSVACEISVSGTIQYEVGNAMKCLRAGHKHVAVICEDREKLKKIKAAVLSATEASQLARLGFYSPGDFSGWLRDQAPLHATAAPEKQMRRGYRVNRIPVHLTEEERKRREKDIVDTMAEAMKNRPSK